jgi:hypothetical protein
MKATFLHREAGGGTGRDPATGNMARGVVGSASRSAHRPDARGARPAVGSIGSKSTRSPRRNSITVRERVIGVAGFVSTLWRFWVSTETGRAI